MAKISVVVNLDTRPGILNDSAVNGEMLHGIRSTDFIFEGAMNKVNFFKGHEVELILYIDHHISLPQEELMRLLKWVDEGYVSSLIFSKHKEWYKNSPFFPKWNDLNFLNAIIQARGEYIAHFDGDMAAFINNPDTVNGWLKQLDNKEYDYISYPSHWSPNATSDPSFSDYQWASTRFFLTQHDTIQYDESLKCLCDSNYMYAKYGEKKRKCTWLEHVLGIIAGNGRVWYPPIKMDDYMIFSWSKYTKGTFSRLMNMPYNDVKNKILRSGGIQYPCDCRL